VQVSLRQLRPGEFDTNYLRQIIDPEYVAHLKACLGHDPALDFAKPSVLVIEDFGTTGLLGTHNDTAVDGNQENWNAFWHREGEAAKADKSSNGRAGQGKITFTASVARAVLAGGKCVPNYLQIRCGNRRSQLPARCKGE
jgi:hypothetical protein